VAVLAVIIPFWRGRVASHVGARSPENAPPFFQPEVVPINRTEQVFDAFHGEVHPLLHGKTSLTLTAHLSKISQGGRDEIEKLVDPALYRLFSELSVATPAKIYTEQDFSPLVMPETVQKVGQVWELDHDTVSQFLSQLHPRPSLHVESRGRRAGPDGAFGVLRADSATHADVVFRIHAEFVLAKNVWLTPACFWGRMIIDKQAGTVEYFKLWVPTENYLNIHLTVRESVNGLVDNKRDIVHIDQMDLVSAERKLPDSLNWTHEIDMASAEHQLKKVFYTFENIRWVPWEQAQAVAAAQHKPILAIVLWGALDDQSC
jgi:hypothetical protein